LTWNKVACGYYHTVATKTDGSLWSWGYNSDGELGLGDNFPDRSSPVRVGTLLTWNNVAGGQYHTVATQTDGSLWTWGNNGFGGLGLGNIVYRSSPVQVGTLLTWKNVAGGKYHTVATKTDGSLWVWGLNDNGQLGLGDRTDRSSPVQVGTLLTWKNVACGHSYTVATKIN
jgi:alpha-tubulin suppressor-like RCC1 family protein